MTQKLNKILLVDDNEADNYLHKLIISEAEVAESVVDQPDGKAALEYLEKGADQLPPDLIFLDINMPRMNGWEFLEAYAQLPDELQSAVVIVMLTTSVFSKDRERAERLPNFSGFLNKPLTEEDLLKVIQQHFPERFD
ncbi:response regulator [Phaeodactylibacter sp.]|uniref:response regulator n=1 Tax=Phaeodactylibacter sp. TaxID=1940289 RepID=UPI0025CC2C53|nr:response regulator [Phaeodactylibacter sp.]MCI4650166.1 response regulator [Phaeodactylibacter sp.]MCI5093284.1 response regulator [Phaeodactylibacter sp.]